MAIMESSRVATVGTEPVHLTGPAVLARMFAAAVIGSTFLFLINNYLIFWRNWPGLWKFFAQQQWLGLGPLRSPLADDVLLLGWIQLGILLVLLVGVAVYVLLTPQRGLRVDSELWSSVAAYVIRGCFWAVLLVGVVDMVISFLRVEGFLVALFGEEMATNLGRSVYRGSYIHYPLVILGFTIALFARGLGFIWLALFVVIAEFQIVISRFIYSYEQVFMGDLVRFWYAALFLFASAYALVTEGHVRVDVFYTRFSLRGKAWTNCLGSTLLGLPLCWVILTTGMASKGSSLNSPLLSFEVYQQGYGMYVKYLMVGFLIIFAVSMMIQFCSYFLSSVADLCGEPGHKDVAEESAP
ncbi:MAG: TRAP transporter small permease subunit [Arenicellales bacterium]|nr:TRAP transporter small permease subunit [Arenicellales bacterium]